MPKSALAKPKQQPAAEPKDVAVGDELYVHHRGQPHTCRVVCHGRDGVTGEVEGQHHQFTWDKVLGHKKREMLRYSVIDEGEDGMILQDKVGNRRFIATPNDAKKDPYVAKAFGIRPVLLLKAAPPRAGLTEKHLTDKRGVQTTRYVRSQKDQPKQRQAGAPDPHAEAGAAHGYGTHNLSAGDTVHFAAGDFQGSGTIVGTPGSDGAHVKDVSGRVHQVRWTEITDHEPREGEKPVVQPQVRAEQKPVPPNEFIASDYAAQHNDAAVTPEAILSQFPPDTADKIKTVQERLHTVEQTIERYKQGDDYDAARAKIHTKIYDHFLSPEKVMAATPADGEQPTLTMLGGRGGSGKSWFKGKVYDPNKAIVIDPDEIKGMLPEYEGWNAHQVHEESGDITDTIISIAQQLGLNVVLDATMKSAKNTIAKAGDFKAAGYRIEAHYMHLPRQEAAKRAVQRFLGKTQRYVPVEVVLGNTDNEKTFDQVRAMSDRWSFRDNNVPQGSEPILISEGGAGVAKKGEEPLKKAEQAPILTLWRIK